MQFKKMFAISPLMLMIAKEIAEKTSKQNSKQLLKHEMLVNDNNKLLEQSTNFQFSVQV